MPLTFVDVATLDERIALAARQLLGRHRKTDVVARDEIAALGAIADLDLALQTWRQDTAMDELLLPREQDPTEDNLE